MCGIAGIWNFNCVNKGDCDIQLVIQSLIHRGPDAQGVWSDETGSLLLGHTRLSILDLSASGSQPMSFCNERYWMVFNGEIYNYLEIRAELIGCGYVFRSNTDSEVILAAYDHWGKEMLSRFNGMWALAIFDKTLQQLFLARDRFGVKPLYYYKNSNSFYFASEVQALHKVLGSAHPLDKDVLKNIAAGGFYSHGTEHTYLENVNSLPAGYFALIEKNKFIKSRWYSLKKISVPVTLEDQAVYLRKLLFDATAIRLRSDVPVGTCLSGGVDSSGIAGILHSGDFNKISGTNTFTHRSFCAAFPGTEINEDENAHIVANFTGMELDIVNINSPDIDELLVAMRACDGPMHSLAFFPIWKLYRHIRAQGIKVTLDGQGPDEMLGGYQTISFAIQAALQNRDMGWLIDVYRTYAALGETSYSSTRRAARRETLRAVIKFALGHNPKLKQVNNLIPVHEAPSEWNIFDTHLYDEFFCTLLPGILQQYDRCSMAHGVECRMPYMDYRIVEFIFSLPSKSKAGGGYTKRVLREALRRDVPNEVLFAKKKIGFNAPIVEWFKGPLNEWALDTISSRIFRECDYFNGAELESSYSKFIKEPKPQWNHAWKLWPPIHIAWWLSQPK